MDMNSQIRDDLKSPWLRGIIAAIVVVLGVNAVFIAYAFISPPNLVVKDYYEKGKAYFHEQHLREAQQGQAWRLQLLPPPRPQLNKEQDYRLYVMDHQGNPVRQAQVTLFAYRPSDARHDFSQSMLLSDAGTFSGRLSFPLPGYWDLIAQVRAGDKKFDTALRIFVEK